MVGVRLVTGKKDDHPAFPFLMAPPARFILRLFLAVQLEEDGGFSRNQIGAENLVIPELAFANV
ncbi:MAG: hypothetical protein ACYC9O_21740 [Candidatus Latescibacterota bacterium]